MNILMPTFEDTMRYGRGYNRTASGRTADPSLCGSITRGLGYRNLAGRMAMFSGGKAKPYDSKVLYVESDGIGYVESNFYVKTTDVVRFKVKNPKNSNAAAFSSFLGEERGSGLGGHASSQWAYIGFCVRRANATSTSLVYDSSTNRTAEGLISNAQYVGVSPVKTQALRTAEGNSIYPMSFFRGFSINNPIDCIGCRIYYFTIDGVCEIIPVRIGNVGYLYDNTSGLLMNTLGGGSLICGPDID